MKHDQRQFGWGVPILLSLALWVVLLTGGAALAQTPNPVTPGYQVCNISDPGNTHCSFQPVDATHGLPVVGTAPTPGTIIGTVSIDQTTPGTTNGVIVNNPTSTGTPGVPATDQVLSTQPVNATASGNITTQNLNPNSGTATASSTVAINTFGYAACKVQVTGTYSGSLSGQTTTDGINWITLAAPTAFIKDSSGLSSATIASATVDEFNVYVGGATAFRVTALGAQTGTAVVTTNCAVSALKFYDTVQGASADSSAATGNPVQVSGVVATAASAAVSNGSNARLKMTSGRQLVIKDFAEAESDWQTSQDITGTGSTALKAAGAAGIRNYVTNCQVSGGATVVAQTVSILDGASVIYKANLAAATPLVNLGPFPTPLRGTAATAMNIQFSVGTGTETTNCQGFQAP